MGLCTNQKEKNVKKQRGHNVNNHVASNGAVVGRKNRAVIAIT